MTKDRSIGKKAIHRWVRITGERLRRIQTQGGWKFYECERCGAGIVRIDDLAAKTSINSAAKKQGISSDCNVELVRGVTES